MKPWAATLRCLAVPSELPGYWFGALRYPVAKFMIAIGIAEAVYATGVIVAGDKCSRRSRRAVLLVLLTVGAGYVLRRYRKRRRHRIEAT